MSEIIIQSDGEKENADRELIGKMYAYLEHYYPNHSFYVCCNHDDKSGVLTIQLLYQDESGVVKKWQHGMLAHIKNLKNDSDIKNYAMRFGGELLERWGLARDGANPYTWLAAMQNKLDISNAK